MAARRIISATIVIVLLAGLITLAALKGNTMPNWSDDFDGPAGTPPDMTSWSSVVNGQGGGNQELEYYIPEANALDGNGDLVITADRDSGRYPAWYGASTFTSGKLWTQGKVAFKYGRIEVRAALPDTAGKPGAWPAIWLLGANYQHVGWPACGEIDMMESFGVHNNPAEISSAVHTTTDNPAQAFDLPAGDDATQFHTYALDWRPTSLTFSVDGKVYMTYEKSDSKAWPFDQPFFLILNVAIGGTMGGAVPDTAVLPYKMVVDYVHVYNSEIS